MFPFCSKLARKGKTPNWLGKKWTPFRKIFMFKNIILLLFVIVMLYKGGLTTWWQVCREIPFYLSYLLINYSKWFTSFYRSKDVWISNRLTRHKNAFLKRVRANEKISSENHEIRYFRRRPHLHKSVAIYPISSRKNLLYYFLRGRAFRGYLTKYWALTCWQASEQLLRMSASWQTT